jgi:hypothetical protein
MMLDFLGREIAVGDYLVTTGGGNTTCEYGMILSRVIEVSDGNVRTVRLKVRYPSHTQESAEVFARNGSVRAPRKYVVVTPPEPMRKLFERGVTDDLRDGEAQIIGHWLHKGELNLDKLQ